MSAISGLLLLDGLVITESHVTNLADKVNQNQLSFIRELFTSTFHRMLGSLGAQSSLETFLLPKDNYISMSDQPQQPRNPATDWVAQNWTIILILVYPSRLAYSTPNHRY